MESPKIACTLSIRKIIPPVSTSQTWFYTCWCITFPSLPLVHMGRPAVSIPATPIRSVSFTSRFRQNSSQFFVGAARRKGMRRAFKRFVDRSQGLSNVTTTQAYVSQYLAKLGFLIKEAKSTLQPTQRTENLVSSSTPRTCYLSYPPTRFTIYAECLLASLQQCRAAFDDFHRSSTGFKP